MDISVSEATRTTIICRRIQLTLHSWAVTAVRGTHYCLRKIDYPLIWKLLEEEGITHFNAAPTVNTLLCSASEAKRLPKPVRVTVAASPPTGHLFEQMVRVLSIFLYVCIFTNAAEKSNLNLSPVHVYGMTETYGPITKGYHMPAWDDLPPAERYAQMARQGHGFMTSLAIRVVKPEEAEKGVLVDVARDGKEIGEIVFFGNICTKGYYRDPEATKKLFAGGALHSGDLAVLHPDGSAQIQDRAKDIIISGELLTGHACFVNLLCSLFEIKLRASCFCVRRSCSQFFLSTRNTFWLTKNCYAQIGGENISSVALESMLVQHPDVLEAGVVAVPDEQWGERPKAYLTAKVKDGQRAALKPEDVIEWARNQSNISRYMVPREVEIVGELPKSSTGKIQKNVLREWAKNGRKV
jgi:acyl-CoA synthetase (AMP-forming)/AMP-acid ligase II